MRGRQMHGIQLTFYEHRVEPAPRLDPFGLPIFDDRSSPDQPVEEWHGRPYRVKQRQSESEAKVQ
jgi:hypothetical protein